MNTTMEYYPEHTAMAFHTSSARVRGIMGPTGCGKTVTCAMELVSRAREQKPDSKGLRPSRWLVVRNTYPELMSTTIKTWEDWCPQARVVYSTPIRWRWRCAKLSDDPQGCGIDMEVFFVSLDRPADIKKVKGLEITGAWLNEASQINDFSIIQWLLNRCGRFPKKTRAPYTWDGLVMDTNAMDDQHWWYKKAEEEKPEGWEFFRQPPALVKGQNGTWSVNPDCENVQNQPKGERYWLDQIAGATEDWIKLNLLGEYGVVIDGKPVFPEYMDARHAPETHLDLYRGLPLLLGWDFGRTPHVLIAQLSTRGQLRGLKELGATNMGITQFARDVVRPMMTAGEYAGMRTISRTDPAGATKEQTDERSCQDILREQGFACESARSNLWIPRRESVAGFLLRNIEGGDAAFVLDRKGCPVLRTGMLGRYHFKRIHQGGNIYKDEPEKDEFSHIQDCLQYVAMEAEAGGGNQMAAALGRRPGLRRVVATPYAW